MSDQTPCVKLRKPCVTCGCDGTLESAQTKAALAKLTTAKQEASWLTEDVERLKQSLSAVGKMAPDKMITVCDHCLQASCWQYVFLCDDADIAGTKQLPVSELASLNMENPCYWKTDEELSRE